MPLLKTPDDLRVARTHDPARYRCGALTALGVAILALGSLGCGADVLAQEADPKDLENRIDYAYFTEDAATLRNLISGMRAAIADGATPERHYLLGLAHYRLGGVLTAKDEANAAKALSDCVEQLEEATGGDEHFAEAYALQSACLGQLAGLRTMTAMINGPKSESRLQKALKIAPKNPRVVLIDGLNDYRMPKSFGGDKARAQTKLKRAADLFEQSVQDPASVPSWGHADVYAALGRSLLESGDTLGARNAVERALIVAPEFATAKQLLSQVTSAR